MNTINIYSPIDGELQEISKLNDGVFSEGLLGFGFFIKPKGNIINSIIDNGIINNIIDTKHAFFFETKDKAIILMHIGIDTVKLKGTPFKILKDEYQNLVLSDNIVEVDFQSILDKGYNDAVCVVVPPEENNLGWEISNLKIGNVKQGELVGQLVFNEVKNNTNVMEILKFKGKYDEVSKFIYENVGTKSNFKSFYNCVTRLRIKISNRQLVNEETIKKHHMIKGLIWNGNELQVVIGPEVPRVRDAFEKYINNVEKYNIKTDEVKMSIIQKIKGGIVGIVSPIIPVLITAGMLFAVQSILTQTGLIQNVNTSFSHTNPKYVTDYDLLSGSIFIICTVGLFWLGIFFGYSTVKYLGGNTLMAVLIAVTLAAPSLASGQAWTLFKLGSMDVQIKAYTNLIIPQVIAAFTYFYLDKWIKTWMPSIIDMVFRHFLSFLITILLMFFVLGPIMGFFETGVHYVFTWLDKVPFGLSTMIFAGVLQITVVFGFTWVITAPMIGQISDHQPLLMYTGVQIAALAQVGATLGVLLRTRNKNLKQQATAGFITGCFGITEPLLYGINVPMIIPFVSGLFGGAMGGLMSGLLDIKAYNAGGMGFTSIVQQIPGGLWNSIWIVVTWLLAMSVACISTMMFYKERPNESQSIRKLNRILLQIYSSNKKTSIKDVEGKIENLKTVYAILKEKQKENYFKNIEKKLEIYTSLSVKLRNLIEKIENNKNKLYKKAKRYLKIGDTKKIEELNAKFINISSNQMINSLKEKINQMEKNNENILNDLDIFQQNMMKKIYLDVDKITKETSISKINEIKNNYFNSIHSIDISWNLSEPKEIIFNKKFLK